MASITKRGAYQFLARVRRRGFPEQSRSFHTREQAEAWAAEVELSFRRGTFKDPGDWATFTVRDALARYLTEITPHKKGGRTEAQRIRWLQRQPFASRPMTRLQVQDLRAWRDAQIAAGAAPGTVGLKLATLSHLYTVAAREWGVEGLDNPVKKLQKPRVRNARDRRIFADEERRLLAEADPLMTSIIVFAIETGMRRSELRVGCERRPGV
ncbi:hypothetical protein ABZN20_02160 [Methylococcus sp. ANG]|uniref:hypothetical protein n=1 Tax=Methylococcus sp. ANG TaxID=3231903 RepID=UPI003458A9E2